VRPQGLPRIVVALLVIALLVPPAPGRSLLAQEPETLVVANSDGQGASLYAAPSIGSDVVAVLPEGTPVWMVGPSAESEGVLWLNVQDAEGHTGYLPADLLVAPQPRPEAGPSVAPPLPVAESPPADEQIGSPPSSRAPTATPQRSNRPSARAQTSAPTPSGPGAAVSPTPTSAQSGTPPRPTSARSGTRSAAAEGGEGSAGTGRAGPARTITLPAPSGSLPPASDEQRRKLEEATARSHKPTAPVPDDPTAPRSSGSPRARETQAPKQAAPSASPSAATDLAFFRNTAVGVAGLTGGLNGHKSTTDEPSVSSNGNVVFYTGNWYAGLSTDGGNSFGYIDPYTDLPPVYGGFCCDQVTIYDPSRNITIWLLQYTPDVNNNNAQRIAIAKGQAGLSSNTWTFFDLTSAQTVFGPGFELDFPHLALSSNFLYETTNVFNSSGAGAGTIIFRFSLDALASLAPGGSITFDYFFNNVGSFTYTPVDGATTTVYFARHFSNSTLRVFSWPEGVSSGSITSNDVLHSAFPGYSRGQGICSSPDGNNACAFDDQRLRGGWVAAGVIGFLWDAGQGAGGLGTFTYPYVHVVRISETTKALSDEPIIFSNGNAWAYPGLGVNGRGHLGASLAFAGGGFYPGSELLIRDDVSPSSWATLFVRNGTNGPGTNRWGDYLTVRPASGNGNSWVGTSYSLQGPCTSTTSSICTNVESRFLWFGRERDNPFVAPPNPCSPRPNVGVSAVNNGDGQLRATITAGFGTLQTLRLGTSTRPLDNARVEVVGVATGITSNTTVNLPAGTTQVTLLVSRLVAGQATTVPLVALDGCGEWESLVGGGAGAF